MSVVRNFEKYKRFNFGQLQIDGSQTEKPKGETRVVKEDPVETTNQPKEDSKEGRKEEEAEEAVAVQLKTEANMEAASKILQSTTS